LQYGNGWQEGWIKPKPPKTLTGRKIAIVGSGPAGMAAAQQLRRVGHSVTVFEKDDRIGGLLKYGIPDFKLDKKNVRQRVNQMNEEGVVFKTNVEVGKDISMKELREEYDAILLVTGSQHARKLKIPGSDLKGIHYAMSYLPQQNKVNAGDAIDSIERIDAKGKVATILGGGFTGADCLGTLNRQNANKKVHQFELVDMVPLPTPVHEEADMDCQANILTERIVGDEHGNVKELHAVRLNWKNENGRIIMEKIPESEFVVKTEIIFLAMGFLGPKIDGIVHDLGVQLSIRGQLELQYPGAVQTKLKEKDFMYSISADNNFMTNIDGVFVAGDAKRGASLVVWAIREGRESARCIDRYLMGKTKLLKN